MHWPAHSSKGIRLASGCAGWQSRSPSSATTWKRIHSGNALDSASFSFLFLCSPEILRKEQKKGNIIKTPFKSSCLRSVFACRYFFTCFPRVCFYLLPWVTQAELKIRSKWTLNLHLTPKMKDKSLQCRLSRCGRLREGGKKIKTFEGFFNLNKNSQIHAMFGSVLYPVLCTAWGPCDQATKLFHFAGAQPPT